MKARLLTAAFFLSSSVMFFQSAIAQNMTTQFTSNIVKEIGSNNYLSYSDFTTGGLPNRASASDNKNTIKENANLRSLYLSSEQYVFDHLGSIKKSFAVADIFFDLDQSAIRADALPVLDQLVSLMMEHPEVGLSTTAYADTRMSDYNAKLSLKRAQAANDCLISKGVGADRLSIEKHGRPQQANPCNNDPSCSLAVQQLNRRTEFNIVYNEVNLGQIN